MGGVSAHRSRAVQAIPVDGREDGVDRTPGAVLRVEIPVVNGRLRPLLLTTDQAAGMLAISKSKLYELITAGELVSLRVDGSRRVALDDLEAYVRRLREEQAG